MAIIPGNVESRAVALGMQEKYYVMGGELRGATQPYDYKYVLVVCLYVSIVCTPQLNIVLFAGALLFSIVLSLISQQGPD